MSPLTRAATAKDLAWIAPVALRAQLVESGAELFAIAEVDPWRVRVTEKGEAALLARWREHLDLCAVLGLWCSPRRVPLLVTDLLDVARERGFARLLGPLVPERLSRPYFDAGLHPQERVVVMRMDLRPPASGDARIGAGAAPTGGPTGGSCPGLTVREAAAPDLDAIMGVDAECFDPFWRYDRAGLERLARAGRVAVGTLEGRIVGYTLATSRCGDGSLGRLAVLPDRRRRGFGRALAGEAIGWMARQGAHSAILSTQEDNTASRSLYRGMGFRETGDVLVACASHDLARVAGEGR